MTLVNEDVLVVDAEIIKRYYGEMDVFLIADVNGGKLEHVHAGEVVEIEVGDVLVVGQQLFVSLQVEHLGAEERVCSNGIDLATCRCRPC